MTKWILLLVLVSTTDSNAELKDKQCEAVAIDAYLEAKRNNPEMDRKFYAAIGSNAYDQCVGEKKKKTKVEPNPVFSRR